jgi:hypothetical protein
VEFKDQLVGINLGEAFTGLFSDHAREEDASAYVPMNKALD